MRNWFHFQWQCQMHTTWTKDPTKFKHWHLRLQTSQGIIFKLKGKRDIGHWFWNISWHPKIKIPRHIWRCLCRNGICQQIQWEFRSKHNIFRTDKNNKTQRSKQKKNFLLPGKDLPQENYWMAQNVKFYWTHVPQNPTCQNLAICNVKLYMHYQNFLLTLREFKWEMDNMSVYYL